jgi:hypothetical protein
VTTNSWALAATLLVGNIKTDHSVEEFHDDAPQLVFVIVGPSIELLLFDDILCFRKRTYYPPPSGASLASFAHPVLMRPLLIPIKRREHGYSLFSADDPQK